MLNGDFDDRLRAILDKWSEVEESIKRAELLESQVVIPAINELRYAGRAIVRAILAGRNDDIEVSIRQLAIVEQYLYNADHDVIDSIVVYISQRVSQLNFSFGRAAIEQKVPEYAKLNDLLDECKTSIELSRKALIMDRLEIYASLKVLIPSLVEKYNYLISADVIMTSRVTKLETEITAVRRVANIILAFLAGSILLNAVFFVLRFAF